MTDNTINCPYCAEIISASAKKCKHCGEILDAQLRDIEMLKSQKSQLIVNNSASAASSSSAGSAGVGVGVDTRRPFPHLLHFIATVLTFGAWWIIWLLHYIFRNKAYYF